MWSSWACVRTTASTWSSLSRRYAKSGRIRSTPGWSGSGNSTPQSTMSRRPRYSKTVMFRPISPSPPSGTMRRPLRASLPGGARSGCGWLTLYLPLAPQSRRRRAPSARSCGRPRQLHAARGEVQRQLLSFRGGGGQQRGAHRAPWLAKQVKRRLGHDRSLVAEHPGVYRHELVVDLTGAAHVACAEGVDHLVQPVPHHAADHADEACGAQGEPREVQHVRAAVINKVGPGQHVRGGGRVVLAVLDTHDPGEAVQ